MQQPFTPQTESNPAALKSFFSSLVEVVGKAHLLTGDAITSYSVDWTGIFRGEALAVVRPANAQEVSQILKLCAEYGVAVVPQGGNTGLVGGGVPLNGEIVLSTTRLRHVGRLNELSGQVTVGAGLTLSEVGNLHPDYDLGISLASRDSATVGGAVATNAGGLRVLRYGSMRQQIRGVEAVLSSGEIVSYLNGLMKNNSGYDYPSLLAGSEGTLAVITAVRLQLVPRATNPVTVLIGIESYAEAHHLALTAKRLVPTLLSAEFFTHESMSILERHTSIGLPLAEIRPIYLLLEADGAAALETVGELLDDQPTAVALTAGDRKRIWTYRERQPEIAGFLAPPLKLDVAAPHEKWTELAEALPATIGAVDPGATLVLFGHIADGNIHVNIAPSLPRDGRHQDAVFNLVASLGGTISAEHGIGALKAPWLHLVRSSEELELFRNIRRAFDPAGILNPAVLPR